MKNMLEIIDRYKEQLPKNGNSVTGFLHWGGKKYYEINSNDPLSINSKWGVEFITNNKGGVELYSLDEKIPGINTYFTDDTYEKETKLKTEFFIENLSPKTWWGKTIDNYYPWPWFPDKEITHVEIVRIIPEYTLGSQIEVKNNAMLLWKALEYPEFFKPLYK